MHNETLPEKEKGFQTNYIPQTIKLIDILRQIFLNKIKSYIWDNNHFLNSIPWKTDPNKLVVTFDVTKLYSNIPHEFWKQVISFWIEKYPEALRPRFNKKLITDGIELILKKQLFPIQ